jgi:hypothetical protein
MWRYFLHSTCRFFPTLDMITSLPIFVHCRTLFFCLTSSEPPWLASCPTFFVSSGLVCVYIRLWLKHNGAWRGCSCTQIEIRIKTVGAVEYRLPYSCKIKALEARAEVTLDLQRNWTGYVIPVSSHIITRFLFNFCSTRFHWHIWYEYFIIIWKFRKPQRFILQSRALASNHICLMFRDLIQTRYRSGFGYRFAFAAWINLGCSCACCPVVIPEFDMKRMLIGRNVWLFCLYACVSKLGWWLIPAIIKADK